MLHDAPRTRQAGRWLAGVSDEPGGLEVDVRPVPAPAEATGETVRKRTVETPDVLTAQVAQIARLAAEGHTNPEIGSQLVISPRTAEYHLHKVSTKLGISSRLAGVNSSGR